MFKFTIDTGTLLIQAPFLAKILVMTLRRLLRLDMTNLTGRLL